MKKFFIASILLLLDFTGYSQNLVLNSDLEQYTVCPTLQGQLNHATHFIALNPSTTAADYLNACANNGSCDVPLNWTGYQPAHSGVGYAGIYLRQSLGSNVKEYIQGTLNTPLTAGGCYHFEMYFNLANICEYATDDISVYFTDSAIAGNSTFLPLPFFPQINNQAGNFPDTINWTLVSGNFYANGGENYFIIGCFKPDAQLNQQLSNSTGANSIYVYIDDILLKSCETGVIEFNNSAVTAAYPNPVTDLFTINLNNNHLSEISIYDLTSRKLLHEQFFRSASLNLEKLAHGIYLYEVKDISGVIGKGKIIKE